MSTYTVLGAQWGDEGKGKITDYLAEKADLVVRYQGGNNAGHTVVIGENTYKLHLIPSGIFYADKLAVIANGVVVNPFALLEEIQYLNDKGVTTDNLRISDRAHIILPTHLKLDALKEEKRGKAKIGTTIKGIGPAYVDKMERSGLRFADIFYPEVFEKILRKNIEGKNELIETFYGAEGFDVDQTVTEVMEALNKLKPYVVDTVALLQEAKQADKKILLEGAQGTLLDIDFGTYPYVTSSHPTTGGVPIGTGLSPFDLDGAIGVVKAYTTRVGKGPFPTELEDETGEWIREKGFEFGTTTGRARRCGWLDTVILKYTAQINGLTSLVVTKLDTLGGLDELEICSGYKLNGELITTFPASLQTLALCEPVYEKHPGWSLDEMVDVKTYEDLPENAKKYLARIEELTGVPVDMFSVGPKRSETIMRKDVF